MIAQEPCFSQKDKGMSVLRQLEFMKVKIDGVNKSLRSNLEQRKVNENSIEGL